MGGSRCGGAWAERALVGPVSFEVLYALLELFVGEMDEGAGFAKLLLDGLVPDAFSFNVDRQAFGYEVQLVAKSFH